MNGDKRTGPIVAKEEASKLSEKRDFIAGNSPVMRKAEKGETVRDGRGFRTRRLEREVAPSTEPKGEFKNLRVISSRRVSVPDDVTSTATARKGSPTAPSGRARARCPRSQENPAGAEVLPLLGARPSWRRAGRIFRPAGSPSRTMSSRQRRQGREAPPPLRGGRGHDAHAPRKTPLWRRFCPRWERGHLGGARDGSFVPQGLPA